INVHDERVWDRIRDKFRSSLKTGSDNQSQDCILALKHTNRKINNHKY
ncbi:31150_t:CDS:1, partial [Racocetra persica]